MDSEQLNGLLLARGLLDRGRAAVNGTGPGAMAAVVLADLAVETAAKAALGASVQPDIKHGALMKALADSAANTEAGQEGLVAVGAARKLRMLRNGVQHDGNEPSARDVERAAVWAEEFIDGVAQTFFSITLDELTRAGLVTDPEVRQSIAAAEELARAGDYANAAARLAIAFEQAHAVFRGREPWRKRLRARKSQLEKMLIEMAGPSPNTSRRRDFEKMLKTIEVKGASAFVIGDIVDAVFPRKAANVKPIVAFLSDLVDEVARLDQRVEAFAVAGDPSELAWFRQRVPRPAAFMGSGGIEYQALPPDPPFTLPDYIRALDFVVGATVRWQQTPAMESEDIEEEEGPHREGGPESWAQAQ